MTSTISRTVYRCGILLSYKIVIPYQKPPNLLNSEILLKATECRERIHVQNWSEKFLAHYLEIVPLYKCLLNVLNKFFIH